jgi:hypothetical protein
LKYLLKMAHQTHALPWNTLASHFKHNTSHHSHLQRLDIHPQKKTNQAKDLEYFCKAFAKQIHDFSVTERAKYQPAEYYRKRASTWVKSKDQASENEEDKRSTRSAKGEEKSKEGIETRKVIPTELLQRYDPQVLLLHYDHQGQDVERWLLPPGNENAPYGAWIGGGEIIKILMMEAASVPPALSAEPDDPESEETKRESMETLLLMANHSRMKILGLRNMHHGHHFGVSRVAEEAVKAYIYLNLIIAMREGGSDICDFVDEGGENEGGKRRKFMDCESYRRMLMDVAGSYDGDAQTLVHRVFFLGDPGESFGWRDVPERDVLVDMERVREYLKGVWRVMVTYDVVIREAGGDPAWEKECEFAFSNILGVRYEVDY